MLRAWILTYPFLGLYVLAGAIIGIPLVWLTGRIEPLYWISRTGVRLALGLSGVRVRTENAHFASQATPCVFVANHSSNIDPPALFLVLPRIAVILKKELGQIPILGYVMKLGDFIYVDRSGKDSRKLALEQAVQTLRKGVSLLIYPEGTRSPDGMLLPFRPGAFTMAIEAQTPIVPITVTGARDRMPKGSFRIRPGDIRVVFHSPIPTASLTTEDRGELMEQVRTAIASALPAPPATPDRNVNPSS